MNTRSIKVLNASAILVGFILAQTALASPPKGMSGFQLNQPGASAESSQMGPPMGSPMGQLRENPKEAAMGGLERLGVLIPLFNYCHTPASVKEPFLRLERLMERTAIAHKIASAQEVRGWVNMGESRTKTQWVMAKEKGYNMAGSCIAVEMELQRQDPVVKAALKKLKSLSAQGVAEK